MWTKRQIKQHEEAARRLALIKQEFYASVLQNTSITEKQGIEFIKKSYKKHGLVNDDKKEFAIVAFGKNTNQVHYFPKAKSQKLVANSLILLDVWARLPQKDAPYADATFMFFYTKSKVRSQKAKLKVKDRKFEEYKKVWEVLVRARDSAIEYIDKEVKKGKMPRGLDIDRVAHDIIGNAGLGQGIKHTIGHSLGFDSPHGKLPGINWREYTRLLKNVGYTIEPGIYLKKFGLRTEIDFYINDKNEVVITTPIQKEIEII